MMSPVNGIRAEDESKLDTEMSISIGAAHLQKDRKLEKNREIEKKSNISLNNSKQTMKGLKIKSNRTKGRRKNEEKVNMSDSEAIPTKLYLGNEAQTGTSTNNVNERIESILNYVKKKADETNDTTRRVKERMGVVAENKPELHFIGEIDGASGFSGTASCSWTVEWGESWQHLEGDALGQTQYSSDSIRGGREHVPWNHPFDLHFATASIQGWPRLLVRVYILDAYGRAGIEGYGWCHLPTQAGFHEVKIPCWRPVGTVLQELEVYFLGASPQITNEETIFNMAWEDRHRLVTVATGVVHVNLSVLHRHFDERNVNI